MSLSDAERVQDVRFRLGSFATGGYVATCIKCQKTFIGDKRAMNCLPCALATNAEMLAVTPVHPSREAIRRLIDTVWGIATESTEVPATKWADRMADETWTSLQQESASPGEPGLGDQAARVDASTGRPR